LTAVWERIAARVITGPFAFALGGILEAAAYWRSRLLEAPRGQDRP
jgi:hypothetical protein